MKDKSLPTAVERIAGGFIAFLFAALVIGVVASMTIHDVQAREARDSYSPGCGWTGNDLTGYTLDC